MKHLHIVSIFVNQVFVLATISICRHYFFPAWFHTWSSTQLWGNRQDTGSSATPIQFSFNRNRENFHSRFLCYQCVFHPVPLSTLIVPFFLCFSLLIQFNLLETKGNIPSHWKSMSLLRHLPFSKAWSNLWQLPASNPASPPLTRFPCSREKSSSQKRQ